MSKVTRGVDNFYALRFARLLQLDFDKWKAFELGIINDVGDVIRKPKTSEEKNNWTKFHVVARNCKRLAGYVPGAGFAMRFGGSYLLLKEVTEMTEQYNLTDEFPRLVEAVVAGDSGGDPDKIAKGETSGAITGPGPKVMNTKRKKKKKEI